MQVLDGKKAGQAIREEIRLQVAQRLTEGKKIPHLVAILVGNNGASTTYVGAKVKACEEAGIRFIGPTPLPGLYLNCGWGTGGFKAIPAGGTVFAHLLATGEHHPLSAAFDLSRFTTGALIDESHAGVQH